MGRSDEQDNGGAVDMDDLLSAFEDALDEAQEAPAQEVRPPSRPSAADIAALPSDALAPPDEDSSSAPAHESMGDVDIQRVERALAALRTKSTLGLEGFSRADVTLLLSRMPTPTLVVEYHYDFDGDRDHDLGLFIRHLCRRTYKLLTGKAAVVRVNGRLNPRAGGHAAYGELLVWYTVPGLSGLPALHDRFWFAPGMSSSEIGNRMSVYHGWAARPVEEFVAPEIDAGAVHLAPMLDASPPPPPPKPAAKPAPAAYDRDKIRSAAKSVTLQRYSRVIDFSVRELQLLMGAVGRPLLTLEINADGDNPAIGSAVVEASELVAQNIADATRPVAVSLVINQPENDLGMDLKVSEIRVRLYSTGSRPIAEQRFMIDPIDMHAIAEHRAAEIRSWLGGRVR
jgi:hypothetical protein